MIDWHKSMQQTFEFYEVDPYTWANKSLIDSITQCTITRDAGAETISYASFDAVNSKVGEKYIRVYLVAIQNGESFKFPLGTFLTQTPARKFNGKYEQNSIDAYSPLMELKEKLPPVGYTIPKDSNIMTSVHNICRENTRAPIGTASSDKKLYSDFVANLDDNWLVFLQDLLTNAEYNFELDEMGRVLFAPNQDLASLQSTWTFNDDNSSIIQPEITIEEDYYGIPNVVEVVYSQNNISYYSRAVNDDPDSPVSTISRGRDIVHRDSSPSIPGIPTQAMIDRYATDTLKQLSTMQHTITFTHGYCGVRLGDCVTLNYRRAGLYNTRAKVISQTIKCSAGCQVTSKALFTSKLWR